RAVIEHVPPEIDGGLFAIKRIVGETVVVEADIFTDGHDLLCAVLKHRGRKKDEWIETAMEPLDNDHWRGAFTVERVGHYRYTIEAWIDRFGTWRQGLEKKIAVGQDVSSDLLTGAVLVRHAARRAKGADKDRLKAGAALLSAQAGKKNEARVDPELIRLVEKYPDRRFAARYEKKLAVTVDRERAGFSTWYELFPRSFANRPDTHGTFPDLRRSLPHVASIGFGSPYLPP